MIHLTDVSGQLHKIDPTPGETLMPQLRPLRLGIVGLCNGNMVCGTCHVFVDEDRLADLPPPDEDEADLLDGLPNQRDNSRLSCQIVYDDALDGISLTVAPRR